VGGPIASRALPGFESGQNGGPICAVCVFGFPALTGEANDFGNRLAVGQDVIVTAGAYTILSRLDI